MPAKKKNLFKSCNLVTSFDMVHSLVFRMLSVQIGFPFFLAFHFIYSRRHVATHIYCIIFNITPIPHPHPLWH